MWGAAKYIPAVVIVQKAGMCNQSCFLTRAGGGTRCCFRTNGRGTTTHYVVVAGGVGLFTSIQVDVQDIEQDHLRS